MKKLYKFLIGCLIVLAGLVLVNLYFQFSVRKSIEQVNGNKPHCLLILDPNKKSHWASLKAVTVNEIHLHNTVFIAFLHPWLYEAPPHILLITEDKSYLWSMRKWQFVAYEGYPVGGYVALDGINNKEFIKECK
jgi:hypothetical protein